MHRMICMRRSMIFSRLMHDNIEMLRQFIIDKRLFFEINGRFSSIAIYSNRKLFLQATVISYIELCGKACPDDHL